MEFRRIYDAFDDVFRRTVRDGFSCVFAVTDWGLSALYVPIKCTYYKSVVFMAPTLENTQHLHISRSFGLFLFCQFKFPLQ